MEVFLKESFWHAVGADLEHSLIFGSHFLVFVDPLGVSLDSLGNSLDPLGLSLDPLGGGPTICLTFTICVFNFR